jgi:hypothetical protein
MRNACRTIPKPIQLTQGRFAIIDDADYEEISKHRWYAIRCKVRGVPIFYAARKIRVGEKRSILFMHRAIMIPPDDMLVDHRDNNGLNCQRSNMRVVSYSQNGMNRRRDTRNTSGAAGISLHKGTGKWKVSIGVNGENKLQNQPRQIDRRSVSGVTGVSLNAHTGRWQASIFANGKRHHLGWHDTIEQAAEARKNAETQLTNPL